MTESATRLPNKERLKALLREGMRVKQETQEENSAWGARVKEASETGNINPKVLAELLRGKMMVKNKGELAYIEYKRQLAACEDMMIEEGELPDPGKKDLVQMAQEEQSEGDRIAAQKAADAKEFDGLDPDKKAADANVVALTGGISTLDPPDPNVKESQSAKATRKRQEVEGAAKKAVEKVVGKEARKGDGDMGASTRKIDLSRAPETTH